MDSSRKERKLEDILVDAGFLSNERLEEIKHIQSKTGQKIEKLLLSDESPAQPTRVNREQMQVTARRMGVDYVDLESIPVNRSAITKMSPEIARKYFVFPFDILNNLLYLAMQNPDEIFLIDEIKIFTQMEIKPFLADRNMIAKAIEYFYNNNNNPNSNPNMNVNMNEHRILDDTIVDLKPRGDTMHHQKMNDDAKRKELEKQEEQLRKLELFKQQQGQSVRIDSFIKQEMPNGLPEPLVRDKVVEPVPVRKPEPEIVRNEVVRNEIVRNEVEKVEEYENEEEIVDIDAFIRNIIIKAAYINSSDVHIDEVGGHIRVRYRVNGKLVKMDKRQTSNYHEITSKFKTMADIPVKKWDVPQKGRIRYEMNDEGQLFISISTLPTANGEKILLKFGSLRVPYTIENIGLTQMEISKVNAMMDRKSGIIIVSGPPETGRTTTSHALMKKLIAIDLNVISVEDKIDEIIDDISQLDIKDNPCETKYDLIKLALGHDPDVLMVDTDVDFHTLRLLINASLSGKLVILTMAQNTIYDAISSLFTSGIENYTLGAALNGVIAQRIVKKVCPECKGKNTNIKKRGDNVKSRGVNCSRCGSTGYLGKVGVFEVFLMDGEYRNLITKDKGLELIGEKLKNEKSTFEENCVRLIVEEVTSIDEIIRLGFGNKLYEF